MAIKRSPVVPADVFCEAWRDCETIDEISRHLGMRRNSIYERYRTLRARGVLLQPKPHGNCPPIKRLNAILAGKAGT